MADHAEGEGGGEEYPGRMLHQAAIYDNTDFLASLLEGDEKNFVNAQDSFGRTALYTAVTNNSLECARILLEHGGKSLFLIDYSHEAIMRNAKRSILEEIGY